MSMTLRSNKEDFLRYVAQTSDGPLMIDAMKAHGHLIIDGDGKEYVDLIAGISVSNIGHSHPEVVKAVQDQAAKYMHVMVYGEFVTAPQVAYARLLSNHYTNEPHAVFFVNSGSEAIETAIKLARRVTGRPEVVSFRNAYHGATLGALTIGGNEERKNAFRPLMPGSRQLPYGDFPSLEQISSETAAVVIEPVQGEAGVILPPEDYLHAVRNRCNETGALLVFDECQTGFGRTGSMFAWQSAGVQPDITTLGKALGGGMPLGAVVAPVRFTNSFTHDPVLGHITTFGGHPVSCAAGLAATGLITDEVMSGVLQKEALFRKGLVHPMIVDVRSAGLLMAIEFETAEVNMEVIRQMIGRGFITDWFLFADNCLRIAPPLTIPDEVITNACETLLDILDGLRS
jgi:acetylornithine/N-succinyldiaminopimelate aminotransferase